MKHDLRLSIVAAAVLLFAGAAAADSPKLDPLARRALHQVRSGASRLHLEKAGVPVGPGRELDVFITGTASRGALEAAGARVRTVLPGIVTAYVPESAVERVAALAGVTGIRGAVEMELQLDASVPTTGVSYQRGPGPNFTGMNGQGVVVGVVDTGVDFDHGDFDNPDGTTRLLGIWDQSDLAGPNPAGYAYGTEWSRAQIDAGTPRQRDTNGHGTHVLGIAGGDGSATGGPLAPYTFVGMAPRADLMAVKTNFSTGIVDGVAWVFDRAAALGKHAVVNLSLGTLFGPKDGTSSFEAALNALAGPGRIIVTAAGNSGNKYVHADTSVPAGGSAPITVSFGGPTTGGPLVAIDGYYEAGHTLSLTVTTPNGTVIGPVAVGGKNATYPGTLTPNGRVYVENGLELTATGDREVYLEVSLPNPNTTGASLGGLWTLQFTNPAASGAPVVVDLWTYSTRNGAVAYYATGEQNRRLVIEPANGDSTITVGAWTSKTNWTDCGGRLFDYGPPWEVGMLALFSSPGPTRDGRQKPDITAPGIGVGAAQTYDVSVSCPAVTSNLLQDLQHVIIEGTSMAAPHVTGAVALLLQKYGALHTSQVRSLLTSRAVTDGFTGAVWNNGWGYGKLHVGDLTDPVAHVQAPNGGESHAIGSVANLTWNASDPYQGVAAVDLELQRTSGGPFETIAAGIVNSGSYAWTVSGPPTSQAVLRVRARDAAGNTGSDASDAAFTITGAVDVTETIADFDLRLLSPTPARGAVDLEFALPRAADVQVAVYDLAGRRLASLARGAHAAGRHHARWERRGSNASSGVYFVRMSAPGREITRRVVVAQ